MYQICEVREYVDEKEVQGYIEMLKLAATMKDAHARDALLFMPLKGSVLREIRRRYL